MFSLNSRVARGTLFLLAAHAEVSFALNAEEVYALVDKSVVRIVALKSPDEAANGSGVVVAEGVVLTNCHVIEDSLVTFVEQRGSRTLAYGADAFPEHDLCVLLAPSLASPAVALGDPQSLRPGQKVYAIGSPLGQENSISDGIVSAHRKRKRTHYIQTSTPISPGSSGGGLFNANGQLVGLTTGTLERGQNLNFVSAVDNIDLTVLERAAIAAKTLRQSIDAQRSKHLKPFFGLTDEEIEARNKAEEEKHKREEALRRDERERHDQLAKAEAGQRAKAQTEERERHSGGFMRGQLARTAQQSAMDALVSDYANRIRDKILSNTKPSGRVRDTDSATFKVTLLSNGEVGELRLESSSGGPEFREAVELAIERSQPLPLPENNEKAFEQLKRITLKFTAKDL